MSRKTTERSLILFVALFVAGITFGCGGRQAPSGDGSTTTSPATTTPPRATDSTTAVAKDAAAPATDGGPVKTDVRPPASTEKVVQESATPVTPPGAKQKSANGGDRPAGRAERTSDTPREPRTAQPEPATAQQAIAIIDLRKFPRLNETLVMAELNGPTYLSYESRSSVAAAAAYHRTELEAHGWKRVPPQTETPASPQFADETFAKGGFFLRLTVGESSAGNVGISLMNLGNVDVRRLPAPPGAEANAHLPTNVNYQTGADIPTTVDFCRKQLTARGWHEYAEFSPDPTEVPHHKSLGFVKNAVRLHVSISDPSKGPPDFQKYKPSFAYMLFGVLAYDLPVHASATNLQLETLPWQMRYESPAGVSELVEFHRSAYAKLGWKEQSRDSRVRESSASLVFSSSDDVHFLVDIDARKGDTTVVRFTQVALDEDRPAASVAANAAGKPEPTEPKRVESAPAPASEVAQAQDKPKPSAKSGDALGDTLAVPDGAKGVSRDKDLEMIQFTSDDNARKIAEFYRKKLPSLGWREVSLASVVQDELAALTFEKGDDELTIAVVAGSQGGTRTIIQGDGLWADAATEPDAPPAKTAPSRAPDRPQTDKAKPKKEHQKLPNRGTIVMGDKTYKLENAVAFHTKYAADDVTAIVLTEKPVPAAKLKASLRKDPPDDDFISFEPHVKLIIDESDQLIYYFLYADGASINRGGTPDPDELTAEATVGDGHVSGKVAMTKPEEFFDKKYRFEVTFYARIENAGGATKSEPEPAPGELVAEEHEGLPVPENNTNRSLTRSPYRKSLQTTAPAELKGMIEFYRRELPARGWKEDAQAAKIAPEQAQLSFTGTEGQMTAQLERKGKEVVVNLVVRDTAKAKADGVLPEPNKARLVIGNGSDKEATVVINDKEYKIAAGRGARNLKDALSLDVAAGRYAIKIKQGGAADKNTELDVTSGEVWGVIVLGDGAFYADLLY